MAIIRQKHTLNKNLPDWIEQARNPDPEVKQCQEDIYTIITSISESGLTDVIYDEGVTGEVLREGIPRFIQEYVTLDAYIRNVQGIQNGADDPETRQFVQKDLNEIIRQRDNLISLQPALRAEIEDKLKILVTESSDIWKAFQDPNIDLLTKIAVGVYYGRMANPGIPQDALDKATELLTDLRENDILERIAKAGKPYGFVIFGADHAWGGKASCGEEYPTEKRMSLHDNIYEWNTAHPDQRFSLVEVTPESYKE